MSRTPSQQCGHPTDRPRIDPAFQHPGPVPMTYQPYPHHEPRHLHPPDAGYERPVHSYMNRSPLPQTLPLRMHHPVPMAVNSRDYNAPYLGGSSPMLDHGHEYPSHRLRTYDQESQ
ncbi:hypothetical protein N7504_001114 [Penicillium tannophilum]|nr:hypothetical protein N7504_001114 [Penicillium tannophilum]